MIDIAPTAPEQTPSPKPPEYSSVFHNEGRLQTGTVIDKGHSFGVRCEVEIDDKTPSSFDEKYIAMVANFNNILPEPEGGFHPNGLSREQASRVLAATQFIFEWNSPYPGKAIPPDEHAMTRNLKVFQDREEEGIYDPIPLSELSEKGAVTCVESSAIAQQLLSGTERMTYVSGGVTWQDGQSEEAHSFNLIQPADSLYPIAILDIANPLFEQRPDGQMGLKLYCAPLTETQFADFKASKPVTVEYGGVKRTYRFGDGLSDIRVPKPQW